MSKLLNRQSARSQLDQAVERDGALSLSVDESWLQGRSWYGGLQMAHALRAVRRAVGADTPLRSVHATFVAPIQPAQPALAQARMLRSGRSVSQLRARIRQAEATCFECTAIVGAARDTATGFEAEPLSPLSADAGKPLPFLPGLTPNFIQHYELRWARGTPPFTGTSDPSGTVFVRPAAEDACYDESEFLALTDVIPPPVLSLMRAPAPASSMNCALELIRPEAIYGTREWVRFEVILHAARAGYGWQTARLYSERGSLLAIAHQSVAVFG